MGMVLTLIFRHITSVWFVVHELTPYIHGSTPYSYMLISSLEPLHDLQELH